MFRIFDDVKIISTTPPAIIIFVVEYKNNNLEKQKQEAQDSFSIIKTSCSVGCHWTMICAAASLIFRRLNGRNSVCFRYTKT